MRAYQKYNINPSSPVTFSCDASADLELATIFGDKHWRAYFSGQDEYLSLFPQIVGEKLVISAHIQIKSSPYTKIDDCSDNPEISFFVCCLGHANSNVVYYATHTGEHILLSIGQSDKSKVRHFLLKPYSEVQLKGFELLASGEHLPIVFEAYTDTLFLEGCDLRTRVDSVSKCERNPQRDKELERLRVLCLGHIERLKKQEYRYKVSSSF